jgi:hypothetical protein
VHPTIWLESLLGQDLVLTSFIVQVLATQIPLQTKLYQLIHHTWVDHIALFQSNARIRLYMHILYCSGTGNSNSFTNKIISINPSYMGGSHSSVPIQCKDKVIHAHRLVDTSCILYCQCSRPSSESDAHKLILLQLSTPSAVGLT